jgi:hypothetical protein
VTRITYEDVPAVILAAAMAQSALLPPLCDVPKRCDALGATIAARMVAWGLFALRPEDVEVRRA